MNGETARRATDTIALDLHVVEGINWASLTRDNRRRIAERLDRSRWRGRAPNRYGFTEIRRTATAIWGYFSQEFPDLLKQYDEQKVPTETEAPNFVNLVFILQTGTGFLLLQDRRFHNEGELSMSQSRRRFEATLGSLTRQAHFGDVELRPKEYVQVAREEFLAVIQREEVMEVEVDQIGGRSIPDDVVLFNPDLEAEKLLRDVWNAHERPNVGQLHVKRAAGGNLRDSKYVRAASHAGEPKRVVYETGPAGRRVTRVIRRVRKTHMPGITVHKPPTEEDVVRILGTLRDLLEGSRKLEEREASRPHQLGLDLEE